MASNILLRLRIGVTPVLFLASVLASCAALKEQTSEPAATSHAAAAPAGAPQVRNFHFEYAATVGAPAGAKSVRVWVPLPQSDENQAISNLKVESPVSHRVTQEALYGNQFAYFDVQGQAPERIPIKVSFDVRRTEAHELKSLKGAALRQRTLQPDRLAPITGEVATRAAQSAKGSKPDEKARGIYDRVLADVAYDKNTPGWGRGDIRHVCEVGKGNCSDFHALFISMARASEIPALFEIGFPLPRDKHEGPIAGYHCWAWYEAGGGVWRPVDASEADKDPSRTDYFFGTLCCNRVALSRGRDLVLEPRQSGEPLNLFIYPYVEVDGKPLDTGVEKTFSFRDAAASS